MMRSIGRAGGSPHEQGVLWFSWLAGVVVGSMIGAGQVLENHAKAGRRTVVITGRSASSRVDFETSVSSSNDMHVD